MHTIKACQILVIQSLNVYIIKALTIARTVELLPVVIHHKFDHKSVIAGAHLPYSAQ